MQEKKVVKRKPNKAKKKKFIFLFVLLLLAFAIVAGLSVTVWFPVKNVQISGSEIYSDIDLASALNINEKENLLLLNEESLLAKLQKDFPYINSLTIKKKLPDTAIIKVSDVKSFYAFLNGEETIITDNSLRILEGEIKTSLTPCIVNCEWNKKGNEIVLQNEEYLKTVKYLSKEFENAEILFNEVSFSNIGNVTVKVNNRFLADLGDINKLSDKLPRLYAMIKEIGEEKQGKINLTEWTNENRKSYFVEQVVS